MFSSSNNNNSAESLESYILSKRGFKDSEYRFVLFIWNGKNTTPLVKSTVLMKAFDLDKKLLDTKLLPYLYLGFFIDNNTKFVKGDYSLLNEVVNNTFENIVDENNSNPSTETFLNFHETVYLLQWLYPIKESTKEKKKSNKVNKNVHFPKFNEAFLKGNKDYYDCFLNVEKKEKAEKESVEKVEEESSNYDSNNANINGRSSTKANFRLKFDFKNNENTIPEDKAELSFKPTNIKIPTLKFGIKNTVLNEGKPNFIKILETITQRFKEEDRIENISQKQISKLSKEGFKINLDKNLIGIKGSNDEEKKILNEPDRKQLLEIYSNVCSVIIDVRYSY